MSRSFFPDLRSCFARVDMLGLWAWSDDLNVVLFEFLEDDTKLAQSCADWLYVQHWYTVVPDLAMRVTLEQAGIVTSTFIHYTSPHPFSFFYGQDHVSEMTACYFLGESVLVFVVTLFLVIISDQKSHVAVRRLPPHRGRRSVEASLVELSLKTLLSVATSSLCVISKHKSTTGVCQLRYRRRRCSEASFAVFSHKTHFSVAMNSFL